MDSAKEEEKPILDLNVPAEEEESLTLLGFRSPVKQTGTGSGGDLRRTERESPDVEIIGCSATKRIKYTVEEKGKAKIDYASEVNLDLNLDLGLGSKVLDLDGDKGKRRLVLRPNVDVNVIDLSSDSDDDQDTNLAAIVLSSMFDHGGDFLSLGPAVERDSLLVNLEPKNACVAPAVAEERLAVFKERDFEERRLQALSTVMSNKYRRKEEAMEQRRIARVVAKRLAHLDPEEQQQQQEEEGSQEKRRKLSGDFGEELSCGNGDGDDSGSPFSLAMEEIRKREKCRKKSDSLFKWLPANKDCSVVRKRDPPRLLDLSLNVLAKNAEAIVSLDFVPDELRSKISQLVSDSRKVDANFVKLLASGCPTEIRVKDISQLTEEEFAKIFGDCDTKELTVLQLDLCGRCMPDYVLPDSLARSSNRLAALSTISLRGAHRLSDSGLTNLTVSAPALRSINLSQCSLLTSDGIIGLATRFKSTLTELYMDDCQNIDSLIILPALKKLKRLEVLSVAGIQTVNDDFVTEMVRACGENMRELIFANCVELTDRSLNIVGKSCPKLRSLDLCCLHRLTDLALKYIANGCQSIESFKLCRNGFSDEAVAAFLEVSGKSLTVLSINNIRKVALNTAFSIAKCSRKLLSLDLSWCRKLTDESLGLIVDSCLSLKLLKIFGCSQITDVFLNGHSNSRVKIIGYKTEPILEHLNIPEHQEMPLRC